MKKRGQFFLIAALLISGIAISFGTIYNKSQIEDTDTAVFDLTEELSSELQQVQDSGTFNNKDPEIIKAELKKVASYYSAQNPDSNFVIYYGDGQNIEELTHSGDTNLQTQNIVITNSDNTKTSSPDASEGTRGVASTSDSSNVDTRASEKRVRVKIKFKDTSPVKSVDKTTSPTQNSAEEKRETTLNKDFEIKPGQNFYIVLRKQVNNEQIVTVR